MTMQEADPPVRFAEAADLAWIMEQERAPESRNNVGSFNFDEHQNNLANADYGYLIIADSKGSNVGFAILRGLNSRARAVELLRIVVSQSGRSYGRSLMAFILSLTFRQLGYRRIWLHVVSSNTRAIRLYEGLGFVREGILRQHYMTTDGFPCDLVVFGMLFEEFQRSGGEFHGR